MLSSKSDHRTIYDISVLIHPGMPIYPGDPELSIALRESRTAGDLANVSQLSMGAHTGTHVDAPWHVDDSWPTYQELDINVLVGSATVFALDVNDEIKASDLASLNWEGIERVLFKTRNSLLWDRSFDQDFVYLSDDAAQFLRQNTGVRLVGIDYLSIEKFASKRLTTHRELLGGGCVIVEGLNLSSVPPGQYQLVCLPLKLATHDGAPARAILIDE